MLSDPTPTLVERLREWITHKLIPSGALRDDVIEASICKDDVFQGCANGRSIGDICAESNYVAGP